MPAPIVHAEVLGRDPAALRAFYAELFDWRPETGQPIAAAVSDPGEYGFVAAQEGGIPGGIGGGPGHAPRALFYVGVPDVGAALAEAVRLGATAVLAPTPGRPGLVVAHLRDPEGNLVGLAGPT